MTTATPDRPARPAAAGTRPAYAAHVDPVETPGALMFGPAAAAAAGPVLAVAVLAAVRKLRERSVRRYGG